MSGPSVLVLSTANWDAPLWTNKQYLACELAEQFDVIYVESLGLRRPQVSVRDARRIWARLRGASSPIAPPRERPRRVDVRSPRVVPLHRGPVRRLNRWSLHRLVADWLAGPSHQRLLWTYSPITYGLEQGVPTVYHCVDLLAAYPGIDPVVVQRGERALAGAGATAVASSREVAAHLRSVGFRHVIEWPNVADVPLFIEATTTGVARDPDLVVFGGNVTPYKVDCDLVEAVLDRSPAARVVLAGPVAEGGGAEWDGLRRLRARGVELPGAMSVAGLAKLYARASVAIIPYAINDYTAGVLPLKVNEYLASGLPVVSSALPSLDAVHGDVVVAGDRRSFAEAVADALVIGVDDVALARRQALARAASWQTRGLEARALVAELLGER